MLFCGFSPLPLRGHTAHVHGRKRVLVCGGSGGGSRNNASSTMTVMELNTSGLKAWNMSKMTGAGPAPRHLHAAVCVRDENADTETIYLYGGVSLDNTKYLSTNHTSSPSPSRLSPPSHSHHFLLSLPSHLTQLFSLSSSHHI